MNITSHILKLQGKAERDEKGKFLKGAVPFNKGKKRPEISGNKHWNWKGGKSQKTCLWCKKSFWTKEKTSRCCSMSCAQLFRFSDKTRHPRFGSGKTSPEVLLKMRASVEYRDWRKKVLLRDNYICQWCKEGGGQLEAHHIMLFSKFKAARFIVKNGMTLHRKCHRKLHNWFSQSNEKCL